MPVAPGAPFSPCFPASPCSPIDPGGPGTPSFPGRPGFPGGPSTPALNPLPTLVTRFKSNKIINSEPVGHFKEMEVLDSKRLSYGKKLKHFRHAETQTDRSCSGTQVHGRAHKHPTNIMLHMKIAMMNCLSVDILPK
ncbi:hypothetical protein NECAME_16971 [Necator americanus]|uniref:Uncharacterized protein n=1 Tax=Necator americanus TaxID=51031 RepID=W2TT88_NECAM|nr:hypothetical protein NECAME_16971 [Necator americanus]ETN84879.1 hypothetical protein NECAME_16971 [Necator americanus]